MKNLKNEKIGMTHDGLLKEVVCMPWVALVPCNVEIPRVDTM